MLTIVLQTPATMVLHVLTETAGIRALVRLDSPDQFVKSTSMSVSRHRAGMVAHAEIKSTTSNASVPRENPEHFAKVRLGETCGHNRGVTNRAWSNTKGRLFVLRHLNNRNIAIL